MTAPSRRRRYDPEAAKQDILEAAEKIFVQKGFAATSTGEIAEAAGVSQSQIHYHFGTKENLWQEIHRRWFKLYYDVQVGLIGSGSGPELLEQSIRAYFGFFQQKPSFSRLMMYNLLEAGGLGGEQGDHLTKIGAMVFKQHQEQGLIRGDIDPGFALMSFLGLVCFWFQARHEFVSKLGYPEPPSAHDQRYLDTIVKILLQGMMPAGQLAAPKKAAPRARSKAAPRKKRPRRR